MDNSRICNIMNEQYSVKISDLLNQKEISKYITDKNKLISILKSNCEFIKFSDDNEIITYSLPENCVVFSILNIPPKMNKEEVKKNIELINLQYNRLYKRGFYWILSTVDNETKICVQNSLRELNFDDTKVKYSIKNTNQLYQLMKEQVDKISYQKESKNLGVSSGSNSKRRTSDDNSDAFSWRKGSGDASSIDFSDKRKPKNYYRNNNKNNFKRTRFNSDNANNYQKDYKYQNNSNNNQDIEIDVSNLKYPILIKNKYSFKEIKDYYLKLNNNKILEKEPSFDKDNLKLFEELICQKPKQLVSLDELIEVCKQPNKNEEAKEQNKNPDVKIPKMNPLCNMAKNFNKFDVVAGNVVTNSSIPGLKTPLNSDSIKEWNKEK